LASGALLGVLAAVAAQVLYITLGGNFHTVVPGQVYRCAQPSASELERLIHTYRIRTVINLRGWNDKPWYVEERATTARLGVTMIDAGMWGFHPPLKEQLQGLVEALHQAEHPILLHCHSGSDRAGMAATMALLLRTDRSVAEARQQLALRFGHNPFGMAACHDRLFDRYEEWLHAQGVAHAPDLLRRWVHEGYDPDACRVSAAAQPADPD
jgi:protein tyrosine/serine phosphatase